MTLLLTILLYAVHIVFMPLLLIGILRKAKALMQNRRGPSILQPFWDIAKLMRKSETISETASGAFQNGPLITLATTVTLALMVPWLGLPSPISGDLILAVYVVAIGKFCTSLGALDTASPFGAIGASREAAISIQAEPAMLVGLAALAVHAHSSRLDTLLTPDAGSPYLAILAVLVVVSLWLAAMAELSRMPFDDATTHLELTMMHEAMVIENSGRNLALVEFGVALKTAVFLGLIGRVVQLMFPAQPVLAAYGISIGLMLAGVVFLACLESVMVKLRWRRVPNLLSFAVGAGMLACLFVAMRG